MICQSACSSCSHATSVVVEVRVAADELGQGRHAVSVGSCRPGPRASRRLRALAGWAPCRRRTGSQVHAEGLAVPADRPLDDLTAELTRMLGSPDPAAARRHGLPDARHLDRPRRLRRPARRARRRDGRRAAASASARPDTDSVFRRSFSALVLPSASPATTSRPLVPGGKVLEWGDRVATWLLRERDLRGFVPGKGWAHAVAHGADALGTLAAVAAPRPPTS